LRDKFVYEIPFADVQACGQANKDRQFHVDHEAICRVIDARIPRRRKKRVVVQFEDVPSLTLRVGMAYTNPKRKRGTGQSANCTTTLAAGRYDRETYAHFAEMTVDNRFNERLI
jgi:hypothetical protein